MGRAIHLVASGEPAWAGAVLKVPRRCMGRLHGFVKSGLGGKLSAIKAVLLECKKAGLLETPTQLTSGVIFAPKGVPTSLAARVVRIAGPPPWDDELYDQCEAEYERDCENIERLTEQEKARRDAEAK